MPDGGLIAYGFDGLMRYDGAIWGRFDVALPEGMGVGQLTVAPDGTLWGYSGEKLLHLDEDRWQVIDLPFNVGIRAFSFAPDGAMWIGTDRGAVRYQP
jgi:ligand-binding sensor domain-containing protein